MSKASLNQVAAYVKKLKPARYNKIRRCLEHNNGKEWTDRDSNNLRLQLYQEDFKVTKADLVDILDSDTIESYSPFDEFITKHSTKAIDQRIIDKVIDTLPLKRPEVKPLIRRWLLQIPAAINGKTNLRLALVFIGPQDSGKTEWFRRLLPLVLKQYFSEFNGSKSHKDTMIQLCESLLILDDEFNHMSHYNQTDVKRILSGDTIRLRKPYGRNAESLRRLAVVCATTNDLQILSDQTGNTRLIPVELTGRYDFNAYNAIDKNKLFVALNRAFSANNKSCLLDDEMRKLLKEISLHYQKENREQEFIFNKLELILKWDQVSEKGFITASDVVDYAQSFHQLKLRPQSVGSVLTKMFGDRKTFQTKYGPRKGYDYRAGRMDTK